MKNSPYYAALLRALIAGLLTGATTFLATWSTTSDAKTLGIATATAFLAPFVARFGGEGAYDTNRDTKITAAVAGMNSSDVGYAALQPHQHARQTAAAAGAAAAVGVAEGEGVVLRRRQCTLDVHLADGFT